MSAPGTGQGGELIPPRSDHVGADGEFLPELFVGEDAFRAAADAHEEAEFSGYPPAGAADAYATAPQVYVSRPEGGKTKRTAIRGIVILGAAALLAGGIYGAVGEFAPKTTTTVTVQEAAGVIDNVSLIDQLHFAEASGHADTYLNASTQTTILHIPFTNINLKTPKYLTEHAGGSESGLIDAVLERGNAVTLSAGGTSEANYYAMATVDVTGLGIEGVNDTWTADGTKQDGTFTQLLNAAHVNSGREDRLNSAEDISIANLKAAGAEVLGDPKIVAAGIAGAIRETVLNPSAELLSKIGPQGAKLLKEMAGRPLYVEFVTYPEDARPMSAGKPIVDRASNIIPGPTPVESSDNPIVYKPLVGPSTTLDFSTETSTPRARMEALLTYKTAEQIATIVSAVRQSGDWFVVAPPPPPQASASPSASTTG